MKKEEGFFFPLQRPTLTPPPSIPLTVLFPVFMSANAGLQTAKAGRGALPRPHRTQGEKSMFLPLCILQALNKSCDEEEHLDNRLLVEMGEVLQRR